MDSTPGPTVAEIDRYIEEGRRLIARAEACRRTLIERDAPEGHLLMAARILAAMDRVQATLLRRGARLRQSLAEAGRAPAVAVAARPPRPWWPLAGRRKAEARPS